MSDLQYSSVIHTLLEVCFCLKCNAWTVCRYLHLLQIWYDPSQYLFDIAEQNNPIRQKTLAAERALKSGEIQKPPTKKESIPLSRFPFEFFFAWKRIMYDSSKKMYWIYVWFYNFIEVEKVSTWIFRSTKEPLAPPTFGRKNFKIFWGVHFSSQVVEKSLLLRLYRTPHTSFERPSFFVEEDDVRPNNNQHHDGIVFASFFLPLPKSCLFMPQVSLH